MPGQNIRNSRVRFHDSRLSAIEILEKDSIQLSLRTEDGHPYRLVLLGVKNFKCDNFRDGNIVFDIEHVEPGAIEDGEIEALVHVKKGARPEFYLKLMAQLESGELKFLRIESSYGAEITSICRRVDVLENETG